MLVIDTATVGFQTLLVCLIILFKSVQIYEISLATKADVILKTVKMEANEMDQPGKTLAPKPAKLNSGPRIHTVGKRISSYRLSSDLHLRLWHACQRIHILSNAPPYTK